MAGYRFVKDYRDTTPRKNPRNHFIFPKVHQHICVP
jgi:hypothetical protein